MTKVIGMMCVRDEADLLPEVLEHLDGKLDALYAYEDGSQDGTLKILIDSPVVKWVMPKVYDVDRPVMPRPNYHCLLEKIKEDYDYENEDIWVIITMGDRFFLNKTPRQIVEEAGDYTAVEGIQLDFLRPRRDPWTEENDEFPNYSESLRTLCRGVKVDERCVVAYKVTKETTYIQAKYPWPRGAGTSQYSELSPKISLDMPYLEHQGRRSPKSAQWRYTTGSRPIGRKYQHWDFSTFETSAQSMKRFYRTYRVWPWLGLDTLDVVVKGFNHEGLWEEKKNSRWYFRGIEAVWPKLPPRTDI